MGIRCDVIFYLAFPHSCSSTRHYSGRTKSEGVIHRTRFNSNASGRNRKRKTNVPGYLSGRQARFLRQKEGRIRGSVARWRWPLGRPPLSTWDRQSGTDWPTPSDSAPYPQKRPCRTQGEMEYEERHKRRRRGNNGPRLAVRGACVLLKMKVLGRENEPIQITTTVLGRSQV